MTKVLYDKKTGKVIALGDFVVAEGQGVFEYDIPLETNIDNLYVDDTEKPTKLIKKE